MNTITIKHWHLLRTPTEYEVATLIESVVSWNEASGPVVLIANGFCAKILEVLEIEKLFIDIVNMPDQCLDHPLTRKIRLQSNFDTGTIFTENNFILHEDIDTFAFPDKPFLCAGATATGLNDSLSIWNDVSLMQDYYDAAIDAEKEGLDHEYITGELLAETVGPRWGAVAEGSIVNAVPKNSLVTDAGLCQKFLNLRLDSIQKRYPNYTTLLNNALWQLRSLQI